MVRAELQGLPRNGVASIWPLDGLREESDGTLLAQAQDPVTPIRYSPSLFDFG